MATDHLDILTGAPGTGKTAILDRLKPEILCVGEPAREILAERRAAGTPPLDADVSLIIDLLLRRSVDKHLAARRLERPTVFDRGVPDCIAYAIYLGVDPTPSLRASERHRYHPEALLLAPWEDIYITDDERTMSFAETVAFHEALVEAYSWAGYAMLHVPQGSVEERATFVRETVGRRGRESLPVRPTDRASDASSRRRSGHPRSHRRPS